MTVTGVLIAVAVTAIVAAPLIIMTWPRDDQTVDGSIPRHQRNGHDGERQRHGGAS